LGTSLTWFSGDNDALYQAGLVLNWVTIHKCILCGIKKNEQIIIFLDKM